MTNPSNLEFRQLLIDISDGMSDDERQRFVFLLGDDIPRRVKDESLLDIFQALIERGRISADDCTYLERIFIRLKLNKLIQKIVRYTEGQTATVFPPLCNVNSSSSNQHQRMFNEMLQEMDEDSIKTSSENQRTVTEKSIRWAKNDLKIFENYIWSDEFLNKINVSTRPYEYQRELVQHAIQSKNTIICLHSDSDKIFILGLLLKYYSMKHQDIVFDSNRKFLAFICVSRLILLKQQAERLNDVKNLRIIACADNIDLMNSTKNYEVILCTPQKLLNALEQNPTLISSIALLCFDECFDHHAYYRYVDIMKYVLCQGIHPYPPTNHLPIIIGLTATIGRRTLEIFAKDTSNILKKLVTLCANFNCSTITTVSNEKYLNELKTNLHPTFETEICCVEKNAKFEKILSKIEKNFQDLILDLFSDAKTNRSKIFPNKDLDENGYEQDLKLLKESAEKNDDSNTSILLNYVLIIYRYRKWLKDLTPNLIISHMKTCLKDLYQKRLHPMEIDTFIYEKIERFSFFNEQFETISNPKLEKLVEILLNNADQPNYRGFHRHHSFFIEAKGVCLALVLVECAFYVERLVEFLGKHRQCKELIRPCSFTKSKQIDERILNDFQNCFFNVLVSTNRFHAGWILPECSMIIRYEFVPDGVGTIQTGRRGCVTKGKEILLTTQNSLNCQREENNREDDRSFERLIDEWGKISPEDFADRVENEKISLIEEWKKELRKSANQRSVSNEGEILCRSCGYFLGSLSALRIVDTYYFVDDPQFYNRIEEKLAQQPEEYKKERKMGDALCGNKSCRSEIGRYVILKLKRKTRPIYPLRCRSVKIRQNHSDKDEKSMLMKTQWKQMPFHIRAFVDDDNDIDNDEFFYDATEE